MFGRLPWLDVGDLMGTVLGGSIGIAAAPAAPAAPRQLAAVVGMHHWLNQPKRRLEPGIEWHRTGGKTHRVVIRREPEWVPDYSALGQFTRAVP